MNNSDLLTECHALATRIAPELAARPLYVVDAHEVNAPRGHCLAWASHLVEYDIKRSLGDRWTEDGPTIAMDFEKLMGVYDDKFHDCALSVLVHEVGHLLPTRKTIDLGDLQPTPQFIKWQHDKAVKDLTNSQSSLECDSVHGPRFIRRVCHLFARATAAGYFLPTSPLLSWPCRFDFYLPLMVGEIMQMRDATFAEIEAAKPPQALYDQWNCDCEFENQFTNRKPK